MRQEPGAMLFLKSRLRTVARSRHHPPSGDDERFFVDAALKTLKGINDRPGLRAIANLAVATLGVILTVKDAR